MYYVYMLLCGDGSIYTGISTDPQRRFSEHKNGLGSRYTKMRGAIKLLHAESVGTRGDALRREWEIQSWSHQQKLDFVSRIDSNI